MQRPNAAQYAYGSATVVLSTVALLLLSGTTTTPGIAAICAAGLLLGLLVAVTMPVRTRHVKTPAATTSPTLANEEIRVPAAPVGAGADTRIGS
ncbi:hypothetical protein [Streptomyces roseicoloratus]|uniref:hypothetical protein n=1 Tax=Streptomyces roseicoloratus TaxID=2508722 RepID=UPI001009FCE4|nr:hypothetical protein [Streptomyces roseicoloratus]